MIAPEECGSLPGTHTWGFTHLLRTVIALCILRNPWNICAEWEWRAVLLFWIKFLRWWMNWTFRLKGAPCSSGVSFLDQNKLESGCFFFLLKLEIWNPMLQKWKANAFFFFFQLTQGRDDSHAFPSRYLFMGSLPLLDAECHYPIILANLFVRAGPFQCSVIQFSNHITFPKRFVCPTHKQ